MLLSTGCVTSGLSPEPTPTARLYDTPTVQINTFSTLTILSKDDPIHAHWVDFFGGSVDIDGDVLVSGAPRWGRPTGEGTGAAYVYRRSSAGEWLAEATLIPSDRDDGFQYDQHFGESIAVEGTVIAVGAPGYDDPEAGDNTGAVYIFEFDGRDWVEMGKLTPSLCVPGDKLGSALAFDGERIAVSGSPQAESVYLFQRAAGGWRESARVPVTPAPDGEPTYTLIDLYGDTLTISSVSQYDLDETDGQAALLSLKRTGLVALYERTGEQWQQTFQTSPQEAALYRMTDGPYGIPVSLGGSAGQASWMAVGKPGFPGSGRETGSVAIYARGEQGWSLTAELKLAEEAQAPGALRIFSQDTGAAFFGAFVRFEEQRLAVVSTFANAVYVFEHQGSDWIYQARITPAPNFGDDFQRRTVAMSGDSLVMGSPGELGGGYIFVFNLAQ